MKLQKHQRLVLDAIQRKWPQVRASISPASKHPKIIALCESVQIQLAIASTPSCPDQAVTHSLQKLRRKFSAAGIKLPKTL